MTRVRLLLEKAGGWSPEWQEELDSRASERLERAVDAAEALPMPSVEEMFGRMFDQKTGPLATQEREASRWELS